MHHHDRSPEQVKVTCLPGSPSPWSGPAASAAPRSTAPRSPVPLLARPPPLLFVVGLLLRLWLLLLVVGRDPSCACLRLGLRCGVLLLMSMGRGEVLGRLPVDCGCAGLDGPAEPIDASATDDPGDRQQVSSAAQHWLIHGAGRARASSSQAASFSAI